MSFIITFLLIFSILLLNYKLNNKEICSPSVIFSASFFLLMINGALNYHDMDFHMLSWKTCGVLVFGLFFFSLGTIPLLPVCNKMGLNNNKKKININSNIGKNKLFFFLLFELIVLLFNVIILGINTSNFSDVLGDIRNSTVNNGIGTLPKYITASNMISFMGGIFFSAQIPQFVKTKKKIKAIMTILGFAFSIIISFSGGSRGSAIVLLSSLFFNYVLDYYKSHNWTKKINLWKLVLCVLLVIPFLVVFKEISLLMGQKQVEAMTLSSYTFVYIGAQLKNLDMALTLYNNIDCSNVFGQETFRTFVNFYSKYFGDGKYANYDLYLPFNHYDGIGLGNVYTTFYPYLRDFGYLGILICPLIMGFISEFLYFKTKEFAIRNDGVSIWNLLWCWTSFCLAFSFFSNKFYENIFTINICSYLLAAVIVLIFFYGIPVNKNLNLIRKFW